MSQSIIAPRPQLMPSRHFKIIRPLLLLTTLLLIGAASVSAADAGKWVSLLQRDSAPALRGFKQEGFPSNSWTVVKGTLRSIRGNGVDLITRDKYQDFELEFDWAVTTGANSGVMYGVTEATSDTYWSGPEMQINDDPHHDDGKTPQFSAGALYDILAPNEKKRLKPTGKFNRTRIVSKNGHIEHWLNGQKILEYDWNSPAIRELIAKSKFSKQPYFMKDLNGYIAFQHHGDEVIFRSIRIRRL